VRSPSTDPTASAKTVDPAQMARLKKAMVPLLGVMNKPLAPGQVKVAVVDDPEINAANAGNGEFYVTTGLLQKATDDQLLAVMAHEVAHQDLGHVAKQQALGTGIGIGAVILDQIFPGAGQVAPVAGALIQRGYSRTEEYQADKHGVELLQRVGRNKDVMINTLTWLMDTSGSEGGGGFLSTHPATGDRIDVLRKM
jgi:putative metalloprotease